LLPGPAVTSAGTKRLINHLELEVLRALEWDVNVVTSAHFLREKHLTPEQQLMLEQSHSQLPLASISPRSVAKAILLTGEARA
jgi:hypothetical protein